jgi:RNA methyltransferase, TrmH family
MREITSEENPRFRALLKLSLSSRERRKTGLTLLDGVHLVESYLEHVGAPETLIASRSGVADPEIQSLLERAGGERIVLADGLFRALSSVATPTGVLALVRPPAAPTLPAAPGPCIMLEAVQDPGNLGSILRSAAASGLSEVYVSGGSAHAWSPRVLRAGMGAHFLLRIHEGVHLGRVVERCPGPVLALALRGKPLYEVDLTGSVALLFGSEGAGLSAELAQAADATVTIPMPGKTESLNIAAAIAVCLFERVRQLRNL